jgi:uncharacterized membrane protein
MEARVKRLCLSMALLAAACAPPADNASSGNEAGADSNLAASPQADVDPGAYRSDPPPADDKEAPKAVPAPAEVVEPYTARGQEPGWALKIDKGRIDYQGNYGEKKINVARPEAKPIPNGLRYSTDRLTVTITFTRCNDAMSGHGYVHEVNITADGEDYNGCGGPRRTVWDM